MATVINNPSSEDSGGSGMFLGLTFAVILVVLFFVVIMPAMRGTTTNTGTQNSAPAQPAVPGKIDVNVNTPKTK